MSIELTARLGEFVAGLRPAHLPADAIPLIRNAFADTIGCMIAGAHEPAPQILKSVLVPNANEATLLFGSERASAPEAAWVNATAAHALDYDDVAQRGGHVSTVLVPAILAEAEALGRSGEAMVTAYAAGHEVWSDLAGRERDSHHNKGWHPTGILGAIGVAAACASLRGLDPEHSAMALALAASQACGLAANFGTMAKPFHAGRAAHAGVVSARLVAAGFTAAVDGLEHAPGYLSAVSEHGRVDLEKPVTAGREWSIVRGNRLAVKKYPMCYCTHRAIDGMLDLVTAQTIEPSAVDSVTVSISRRNQTILRNHAPQTGLEAKFSIEFSMASALIAKRVGLQELTDAFVRSPDVQAFMKRVSVVPEDREDPARPGYAIHDRVVVRMKGGRTCDSGPITEVRGDADLPLTTEQLWIKFDDCLAAGGAALPPRDLFGALMSLDKLANTSQIPGVGGRA